MNPYHAQRIALLFAPVLLLLIIAVDGIASEKEVRTWTRKDGKIARGVLVEIDKTEAVIQISSARTFRISIAELDIGDQQYVKSWKPPAPKRPLHVPEEALLANGKWFLVVEEKLSWHDAVKKARRMKGILARVTSSEEIEAINKMGGSDNYLWIGATDERKEGEWKWLNGDPVENPYWDSREPSQEDDGEDYVNVRPGGKWNDLRADSSWASGFVVMWEQE